MGVGRSVGSSMVGECRFGQVSATPGKLRIDQTCQAHVWRSGSEEWTRWMTDSVALPGNTEAAWPATRLFGAIFCITSSERFGSSWMKVELIKD